MALRKFLFAAVTLAALPMIDAPAAQARDYPFCLVGRDFAGFGECLYNSYAQCQASASGREAQCAANPYLGYFDRKAGLPEPAGRRVYR